MKHGDRVELPDADWLLADPQPCAVVPLPADGITRGILVQASPLLPQASHTPVGICTVWHLKPVYLVKGNPLLPCRISSTSCHWSFGTLEVIIVGNRNILYFFTFNLFKCLAIGLYQKHYIFIKSIMPINICKLTVTYFHFFAKINCIQNWIEYQTNTPFVVT